MKKIICYTSIFIIFFNVLFINSFAVYNPDVYDSLEVTNILQKTDIYKLQAKSAILIDSESGNILFEKNSKEQLAIASVTKIMSMLLVFEALDSSKIKYDDMVSVSEYAASMGGSQAYLKPGEEFTVSDMIKAVAVHSSNDVTVALAEKLEGSETAFVSKMNEKAKQLGMNNTLFADCTGLTDDNHYSSAEDIAIMSRELIQKHPKVIEYTSIWHDTFRNGTFSLDNTNKLIKSYTGADGLKTGHTTKAGYCLAATAKRNNIRLISIVLGEPDTNTRFAESKKILDYGFMNYEVYSLNKKGEKQGAVKIINGTSQTVDVCLKNDVKIPIIKSDKSKLTVEKKIYKEVKAPVKLGQKVGTLQYKIEGRIVSKVDIVAENDVEKASFIRLLFRIIVKWLKFW